MRWSPAPGAGSAGRSAVRLRAEGEPGPLDLPASPFDGLVAELGRIAGSRVETVAADLADREELAEWWSGRRRRLGPLDVLVNNAGHGVRWQLPADRHPAELKAILAVNLLGD